jgi:hypothetical protein
VPYGRYLESILEVPPPRLRTAVKPGLTGRAPPSACGTFLLVWRANRKEPRYVYPSSCRRQRLLCEVMPALVTAVIHVDTHTAGGSLPSPVCSPGGPDRQPGAAVRRPDHLPKAAERRFLISTPSETYTVAVRLALSGPVTLTY